MWEPVGSVIADNDIGVDKSGENPIGNNGTGVSIYSGWSDDSVDGNMISDNSGYGIDVVGAVGISISFNKIGVDADGETQLGNNGTGGVAIFGGSTFTTVDSNIISNNGGYGVSVSNSGTADTVIDSNNIGTDASGTEAFGNALTGISVFGDATNTTIGSLTVGEPDSPEA